MDFDGEDSYKTDKFLEKMKFLGDALAKTCFKAYETPAAPISFLLEPNRNLFPQIFKTDEDLSLIPRLSELCIKTLSENYRFGAFSPALKDCEKRQLGELIDVEAPLIDLVELENETYWKRVALAKCQDRLLIYRMFSDENAKWKSIAVEAKYNEVLEETEYEVWNEDDMSKLTEAVSPFVKTLKITKMAPLKEYSVEKNPDLSGFPMYNVPDKDCHHGNLDIIGSLKRLEKIYFEFQPLPLGENYERRFFSLSYNDVENMSKGIRKLSAIKDLRITRSQFDRKKLDILLDSLHVMPLVDVDLCYCQLRNDSCEIIANLLKYVSSIENLNLEGNFFSGDGVIVLFKAIRDYSGSLGFLSMAKNPLGDEGVASIYNTLSDSEQVKNLDISGIVIKQKGTKHISNIIAEHSVLRQANLGAIDFGQKGGDVLVKALEANRSILDLEFRGCNLTINQMAKIKTLLKRNNYYHENPCFTVEVKSKEDEEAVDTWASRVKHPVLLRALEATKKMQQGRQASQPRFDINPPEYVPTDITQRLKRMDLLKIYYTIENSDRFFLESEMNLSNDDSETLFLYDPNQFDDTEIVKQIHVGNTRTTKDKVFFRTIGEGKISFSTQIDF